MGKKKGGRKKDSSDDETEILCPCGSAKGSRYWILCDGCETWYHGKCANFTEKQIATIDKFFCHDCCDKNPKLTTTYKVSKETKKAETKKAKEAAAQNPALAHKQSYSSNLLIQTPAQAQSIAIHAQIEAEALAAAIPMDQTKEPDIIEKLTEQAYSGELNINPELIHASPEAPPQQVHPKVLTQRKSLMQICARLMMNPKAKQVPQRCGECIGCKYPQDCEKCIACFEKRECLQRICVKAPITGDTRPYDAELEEMTEAKVAASMKKKKKDDGVVFGKKAVRPRLTNFTEQIQCKGPGCVKPSRPGSKYCCHECGLEQARRRCLLVLPTRVQKFCEETPEAFEREANEVVEMERRLASMQNNMNALTDARAFVVKYLKELSELNEKKMSKPPEEPPAPPKPKKGMPGTPQKGKKPSQPPPDDCDFQGRCSICSFTTSNWGSLQRHILRCYMRIEKKTDFTSPIQATYNPDGIICDFFCKKEGAYCKRLRALCFDHTKGFLYDKLAICGAPLGFYNDDVPYNLAETLDKDQFMSKGPCMLEKTACNNHVNWAQSLIGVIDNTRITLIQSMAELAERIRYLRDNVNRCFDIPTLLQTYTVDHTTDAFGMPKNVNFVTGLPEYFERKLDWTNEVKEINSRIQEKLNIRFKEQERVKEEEKNKKEAAKIARAKKRGKKKPGPPAKRRMTVAAARAAAAAAAKATADAKAAAATNAQPTPAPATNQENAPIVLRDVAPVPPRI
uniref:CXXC-type zinc finger protein 1 n=1 Tax=Panagrellus redivivus TaxID=6233 RepID=A0A7E4ZX34_PANRE